jgi:small subunit ribosomal protein S1
VYVSEISWRKNVSPIKVTSPGAEIEVVVLDVDVSKRRIGLGMKQLNENPWKKIATEFHAGSEFESVISSVTDFGIFIKMNDDLDGMVHVNDLSWEKDKEAELSKYKKGDSIKVKVLEIDQEKERISLGVKQLIKNPNSSNVSSDINLKRGAVVTCVVTAIKDEDGIAVTLSNGASGFIKKIDLAKDRQDRRTDRFAVGEKVDAKIVSIDKTNKKVGLSIKALEIDEEKQVMAEYGSSDSGASLGDILGVVIEKNSNKDA